MDMVADSQAAIDAFGQQGSEALDEGSVYLAIFGLLQALFVQQDASLHLAESLHLPVDIKQYPRLKEIREIRNDAVGHPTKRSKPGKTSYSWNFIIQHSLSCDHFELLCWHSPTGHTKISVNTRELITDQRTYIGKILETTDDEVKRRDNEYKARFKMKKLADTLPHTTSYMCEKMSCAIDSLDTLNPGEWGVASLQNALAAFEAELRERGIAIDTYPGIQLTYADLQYPLKKLHEHFSGSETLDREAAHIFVDFVRKNINDLMTMAEDLDREFAE
jgi:hypothetical protein